MTSLIDRAKAWRLEQFPNPHAEIVRLSLKLRSLWPIEIWLYKVQNLATSNLKRLGLGEIQSRLGRCPSLPSLSSINKSLLDLVLNEQRYSVQIGEIISRDPSLTSRLLRLVNSVYYGLSSPVTTIEDAVFYLGIRQIRQLVLVTPVIEDFQKLTLQCAFPWREFWQHCIGTGILTHEIACQAQAIPEESDYIAGLVHDVGKIVMAWAFPDHFAEIHRLAFPRYGRPDRN